MSDLTGIHNIVTEFVAETTEKADELERELIDLEHDPSSRELIAKVFRALHSIKGATSFLGFAKLCNLAHTGETLLARLRDGALTNTPEITTALLSLVDATREILAAIASTGKEGNRDYSDLTQTLAQLRDTRRIK